MVVAVPVLYFSFMLGRRIALAYTGSQTDITLISVGIPVGVFSTKTQPTRWFFSGLGISLEQHER